MASGFTQVVTAPGYLTSLQRAALGARVAGRMEALVVNVGDVVEGGDGLARFADVTQTAELASAQASLAAAEAELAGAEAQRQLASRSLQTAEAARDAARAPQEAAEASFDDLTLRAPFAGQVVAPLFPRRVLVLAVSVAATCLAGSVLGIVKAMRVRAISISRPASSRR